MLRRHNNLNVQTKYLQNPIDLLNHLPEIKPIQDKIQNQIKDYIVVLIQMYRNRNKKPNRKNQAVDF